MRVSYRHIILTRFNLQYDPDSVLHIQPAWLDNRLALFEQYCLPSVLQQTCKDFTWLLLTDEQTPDTHRQRLLSYETRAPYIKVIFCPYYDDFNVLYRQIGEQYAKGYDWLLSTRLDNDDMLALDFVEQLHTYMDTHQPANIVFTYPFGIQYFAGENIAFEIGFKSNHFLTFLEDKHYIRTCLGMDHTKVSPASLRSIGSRDMWCEIVHSSNICNDYVPKYHYYWRHPQGQYPVALPRTAWHKRIPFLTRHWFAFRTAQVRRLMHRLFAGFGHNV